jgi:O-antigen ligase
MNQEIVTNQTQGAVPLNINLNMRILGFTGLILIIYYAFFNRGLYFRPELLISLVVVSIVFIVAAADIVIRGETDLFRFPIDYPVTVFAFTYLLALWGAVSKPEAVLGVLENFGYLAVFLLTCQVVRSWRLYRILLEFIFGGAILVSLIGLFSATGFINYPAAYVNKALLSTFQYENAFAIFLLVASIIGLSLFVQEEKSPVKDLWYLGGLALLNISLLGTASRAVWLMYPVLLFGWMIGLKKETRSRVFLLISYMLVGSIIVSRGFLARVQTGKGMPGLMFLVGGCLVILAGWMIIHRINRTISRKQSGQGVKKFWQGLGIFYLIAVLVIYGFYAVTSLPGGWDAVIGKDVTRQITSITGYDSSFQLRTVFYRDAIAIIKDHLLTGTGAGGWKALYHKYQSVPYVSNEVHNNFLQVMVETGIPGFLLYTAVWILSFYSAYRLFRHFRKDANWPLVWGVIISLAAICLHSAFDFDLSLPTLSMLTWIMFALVRNGHALAHKNGQASLISGSRRWILLIVGVGLGTAMLMQSYKLYNAGELGAEGAQAMTAGNIKLAEEKMRQAVLKDPYSGSYLTDLAKINLVYWLKDNDKERLKQGIVLAQQAVKKEPYNMELKTALITSYLMAGMSDEGIAEAESMVEANRFDIKAYEIMAGACVNAAMYYRQKDELAKEIIYINRVIAIPDELNKKRNKVIEVTKKAYRYDYLMDMTPPLLMAVGQANMLAGRLDIGMPYLEKASRDAKVGNDASAWLAAAYKKSGNTGRYEEIVKARTAKDKKFSVLPEQVEKIVK